MSVQRLRPRMASFGLRRRALQAHRNHSHARKWMESVRYLRARHLWVVEDGRHPGWRADHPTIQEKAK